VALVQRVNRLELEGVEGEGEDRRQIGSAADGRGHYAILSVTTRRGPDKPRHPETSSVGLSITYSLRLVNAWAGTLSTLARVTRAGVTGRAKGGGLLHSKEKSLYIDRKYGAQTQENMRQVTGITARRTEQASPGNVALASIFDIASQRG